jgi:hypothetical protein
LLPSGVTDTAPFQLAAAEAAVNIVKLPELVRQ